MKKLSRGGCKIGIGIIILIAVIFYMKNPHYDRNKKYIKEYTVGEKGIRGSVDVAQFGDNSAYEIGANKEGYAVFKNPDKAFHQMKIDFAKGIAAIKKENNLYFFVRWNFEVYAEYGWQLTETDDEEAIKQAAQLSAYLDIYENSFDDYELR